MSTELALTGKEYGLEENQAVEITKGLEQILVEREILIEAYNDVITLEITKENIPTFKEVRSKIRDNRTKGIEAWRKVNKEYFLRGGQFVDATAKKYTVDNERMEANLKSNEDHFENIEKERLAALQIERVDMIRLYVEDAENMSLSTMEDEVFEAYLATKKKQYEDRLEAEKLAEQQRIEAEKKAEAERVAEAKRLADEAEKNRVENERLKAEAEAREKAIELERQENTKKLAEQQRLAKIEADKIEALRKKEAEAREKVEAELQAKKDAELKAEILEEERKEAAKKEAIKAAKAPVKTKLSVWVNAFELPLLDIENETAKDIIDKFEAFRNWSLTQIDKL